MTPEEKSIELLNKFSSISQWVGGEGNISLGAKMGKQCAIICVEQIFEVGSMSDKDFDFYSNVLNYLKSL